MFLMKVNWKEGRRRARLGGGEEGEEGGELPSLSLPLTPDLLLVGGMEGRKEENCFPVPLLLFLPMEGRVGLGWRNTAHHHLPVTYLPCL